MKIGGNRKKEEKKKPIRLLYTCHNEPSIMMADKHEDIGEAARVLIKEKGLRLVALHSDMAEELNKMFGVDDTAVIRNGIDMDRFRNASEENAAMKRELGIPEDAFVIGNVGRFSNQKNHKFLISVFEKVKKQRQETWLLLVGAGELEAEIRGSIEEKRLTDCVMILKHRTDMHRVMRAMDIFVFPSLFEGLGIVAIEAQASGLPCIISEGVPRDAVITNRVVRLSLKSGAETWADAILEYKPPKKIEGDFASYNMRSIIRELEDLYR